MTMHVMERDSGEIVAARLAEMMGVAPATVTMTLRRMERDKWISGHRRREIHLTKTGREAAHSVIRRHMLIEWLLVKVFKIPIFETHDEAHRIEHAISPKLEERMYEILDDPKLCPHGNPFPGHEALTKDWVPLTEVPIGVEVTIHRIHEFAEDNQDLLDFLSKNSVEPGKKAQVQENLPFNQTLTIEIDGNSVTLGFAAAKYIFAALSTS
ncbi:MAG: metal-dependent transcriptional regulator [Anaerolineae bacterium]|jgi:DtxR family transcriptional regulator, Mn-dependent transcriptional regulator|nr:metal-dependent transcriptional regulator [Anaerolineae bacterium]MBT7189225.1 metal-dependent transcriptional regulator [Anaerolineae bacterium]MBT7988531.1 metal-dependent transcriptional regulator [Anaerolineae bacterium]